MSKRGMLKTAGFLFHFAFCVAKTGTVEKKDGREGGKKGRRRGKRDLEPFII